MVRKKKFLLNNIALRGGVQFGIADAGQVKVPDAHYKMTIEPVSYTHLTLPTIYSV